ncbi:HNH endonuclease [Methylorubrum thiocyanatum]|uniref:HNH endonuclease n=1 Tax=Methylorubrum thiocyanatum TaxID=47958 RepID=UPI003F7F2AB0
MARIALTARAEHNKGLFAEVDDEDFASLSRYRWYAQRAPGSLTIYARRARSRREGGGMIGMHQEVLGVRAGLEIDHREGNGLNNRRSNLRHITHAGNIQAFHPCRHEGSVDSWLLEQGVIPEAENAP